MARDRSRRVIDEAAEEEAYKAGMELARRVTGSQGGEVEPAGQGFDDPFFNTGQTLRRKTVKKTVHIISNDERIVTEETTYEDIHSYGQDIFKR